MLSDTQISELRSHFEKADKDRDGKVALTQLKETLKALRYLSSDQDFNQSVSDLSLNSYRIIDFEDTLKLASDLQRKKLESDMLDIFKTFRSDNGQITPIELRYLLITLNEKLSDEEIDALTENTEKPIYFEDFSRMVMTK